MEYSLDIDDFDIHLTPVLRPSSSTRVEPSPSTPNPVRITPGPAGIVQQAKPSGYCSNPVRMIPGPAGIVQQAKLLKEKVFILDSDEALMSTQEYMQKVVEDVGEDDDFNSGPWVSDTNYVNANCGTVTGCLGDIKNFLKNGKLDQVVAIVKSCSSNDITVGAALILANVSVFSPKPTMHYLNITKRNVVQVFCKDTIRESGSG
ncbi:zf-CCHC domain-containing protein [Tanacetum coccineum]